MKEKFCRNCGSPIKQGQSFCTVCGKKIQETQESGKEQKKDRKWKIAFGICFIVAAVIIAGLIVLLVGKQQNLRPDENQVNHHRFHKKKLQQKQNRQRKKQMRRMPRLISHRLIQVITQKSAYILR